MGNLRSVEKAIEFLGFQCHVTSSIAGATKLIIPGVGAFGAAMERLAPLAGEIRSFAHGGGPLLGICLGQQLLFDVSEEHGENRLEPIGLPYARWTGVERLGRGAGVLCPLALHRVLGYKRHRGDCDIRDRIRGGSAES